MNLLGLGVNASVILAIIALSQVIKTLDKENKFKRFYILIPSVLAIIAALALTRPLQWQEFLKHVIIYVGMSTYIFKTGKTTILGK